MFQGSGFPETGFLKAMTSKISESRKYALLSVLAIPTKHEV